MDQRFYTPEEMADLLHISVEALAAHRKRRTGPPFVLLGRTVRYPSDALRAWAISEARKSVRQIGEVVTVARSQP